MFKQPFFGRPRLIVTHGEHMQKVAEQEIAALTDRPDIQKLALDLSDLTLTENGPRSFEEAVNQAETIISTGREFVK